MKKYLLFAACIFHSVLLLAQVNVHIKVTEDGTNEPLDNVLINTNNKTIGITDSLGEADIQLPDGNRHTLSFSRITYGTKTVDIDSPFTSLISISLGAPSSSLEGVTVVASTRNDQNIENSPLKVEVLGAEELSEEASIKPGNIASILGDVSGIQIQQSSATSGNSNVRIQGLGGKYTQILRDGMPQYDGFSGGFGILTIPPLDLQQIELIKGSASTLYGGGAIGGLINLISKKPRFEQEADVLLNYSTLKEFNANAYLSKRNKKFGYTLFTGYTNQQAVDVNKDQLSDVPDINDVVFHPRVFYYPSDKTTLSVAYTGTFDDRKGGDMQVLNNHTDLIHQYYERNVSTRHSGQLFIDHYYSGNAKLSVRGNVSSFGRDINTNTYASSGNQLSYYGEVSMYQPINNDNLVAGVNVTGDDYKTPNLAPLRTFSNFTVGAFGQYSWHIKERSIIETGLRLDHHNRYGFFVLPRVALFHRFSEQWATRLGFGMGYKTPNPLVQQNTDYNPQDVLPVSNAVKPEMSYGYNAEVNYKKEWVKGRSLFINHAFFLTRVNDPILFVPGTSGLINLVNANKPLVSKGFDTYVKLELDSWELYLGYTYTSALQKYLAINQFVPLTPRNRMAFVVVKEFSDKWRIGLEGSLTGRQYRYDGTQTPAYFFAAAMIQHNIGDHFIVVLNGENLLDYRMSRVESLYTGYISNPVFKPLWAPIDGRVINLSVRWKL